jgi:superfamily I DNA/RNA helicase
MSIDLLQDQVTHRKRYLDEILSSQNPRKLIVAGPGTGKTYTFGQLFRKLGEGKYLALTFINKLVQDMESELGELAEVKTLHSYCKKLLHEKYGDIKLFPFLTQVIEEDSKFLNQNLSNFDDAFQTLDEDSNEIRFYLARGGFYQAVSFNDSVYRVLRVVQKDQDFLPRYTQIVVDEFQDFNPLEVAFIDELQKRGPILIVGDDEQAVYSLRNSSPIHLRKKYKSGKYETFVLPFCSRCPRVIVEATSSFVEAVIANGQFTSRINRPFVPFLEDKEYENKTYPKIISTTTSTIACLAKLILFCIRKIPNQDISEAYEEGYPCVLIVGQRQYLNPLNKRLEKEYQNVAFTQASGKPYSINDGYEILRDQEESNLGWRLIAGLEFSQHELREIILATQDGTPLIQLLPNAFIKKHSLVLEILKKEELEEVHKQTLHEILGDQSSMVANYFFQSEEEERKPDKTQPSILLSSFEGCKGLSAGHVFIIGLNQGIMPRIYGLGEVADIDIAKFIVAMTRTRKLLYLLSNRWDYDPRDIQYTPSMFIEMIPPEFRLNGGYLRSKGVENLVNTVWGVK